MIGTLLCFKYHHDYEWRQAKVYQNFSFLLFLIGSLDLKFKGKRSLLYQLVQLALSSTMSEHNTCSKTATEHLKEAVLCLTQTQTTLSSSQTDLAMRLALYSNNSMPLVPPYYIPLHMHNFEDYEYSHSLDCKEVQNSVGNLFEGMHFLTKQEVLHALQQYHVSKRVNYTTQLSNPTKLIVICDDNSCP